MLCTDGFPEELADFGRGGEVAVLPDLRRPARVVAVVWVLQRVEHVVAHLQRPGRELNTTTSSSSGSPNKGVHAFVVDGRVGRWVAQSTGLA